MAAYLQDSIVLLGDSITSRQEVPWNLHHCLSQAYRGKLDVLNRGYGGYNTVWVNQLFDKIFTKKEDALDRPAVRLVTIFLGTNDSVLPGQNQHVPVDVFKANLRTFLTNLTSPSSPYAAAHSPQALNIVLITPTIFSPLQWEAGLPADKRSRSLESTRAYRDAVLEVGLEWKENEKEGTGWKFGVIDLWQAMVEANGGKEQGPELARFFTDGLHFTTEGYKVLWGRLERVIKVGFHGRGLDWEDLSDLPFRAPRLEDIDYSRPESVPERMGLPACRR
ncbi:hypothetical protein IAT38_006841 [Cryptococcus sp. DSM 104549]